MRVIEVNMKRPWNEGERGTGDPRENPPTNSIVQHEFHLPLSGTGMKGWGKQEIPEKTRRPPASSSTIPTYESPVTRPGIEPGSSWWEANRMRMISIVILEFVPIILKVVLSCYVIRDHGCLVRLHLQISSRGGVVVRLPVSHLGETGLIPSGYDRTRRCRWSAGFFFRGTPVFSAFAFRRCSIPTSLHPHRLSRP
ncbi:hypothetical protein PR048_028566 [Dryococelus australis]|uniref:Uncharacterized protein n=1 Tax=Dryococelus australis TaxID=614101 RepID=A0ABQ9GAY0_9NEOP|nr:hypothetical protein PR048_028566 [Dryococelus australis]